MSFLMEMLSNGLEPEEVLAFVKKNYPRLGKKVMNALTGGMGAWEALGSIASDPEARRPPQTRKPPRTEDVAQFVSMQNRMSVPHQREQQARERFSQFLGGATRLGSLALGGYLGAQAGKGLPALAGSLGNLLSQKPDTDQAAETATSPVQQTMQSIQETIPEQMTPQGSNAQQIIEKMGLGPKIQNMLQAGNEPENIGMLSQMFLSPGQKKWLKGQTSDSFIDIVKEYIGSLGGMEKDRVPNEETIEEGVIEDQTTPQQKQQLEQLKGVGETIAAKEQPIPSQPPIVEEEAISESPQGIEEARMVRLPSGELGEVIDVRQGISTVRLLDGAERRQKNENLEKAPQDVIKAAQELLQIPEEERSAPLAYTAYSPENRKLYLMFHNGDIAEYDDIDEDIFEEITEGKFTPRTAGENQFGLWNQQDPKSRGATFFRHIIENPKYAKDKKGETWRYLRKGYDYWDKLRKKPKRKKS